MATMVTLGNKGYNGMATMVTYQTNINLSSTIVYILPFLKSKHVKNI